MRTLPRSRFHKYRPLQANNSGLEGFPLQLLITVLIMALVTSASYTWLTFYDQQNTQNRIESELQHLAGTAQRLYRAGPGNRDTIELDLTNGMFATIEFITIGSNLTSSPEKGMEITYKISGDAKQKLVLTNPATPLNSTLNEPLELCPGTYSLRLETFMSEEGPGGGGIRQMYVQVQVV